MTTFIQQEKKQKILIFIFITSISMLFIILWYGFHQKTPLPLKEPSVTFQGREIKIDWQIFENENSAFRKLEKKLQPFERIKEFDGDFSRTNPFIPY